MQHNNNVNNPREKVREYLLEHLGQDEEIDLKSAVLCGEMGCGEMSKFIAASPNLRCPFENRIEQPQEHCKRLREIYQNSMLHSTKFAK